MVGWVVFWFLGILQRLSVLFLLDFDGFGLLAKGLVGGGVGAEGFDGATFFLKGGDGFFERGVFEVAVEVDEEVVFPSFAFAGTGFDFGEVELVFSEGLEGAVKGANFVGDATHEAGAVFAGWMTALGAEDEESGNVGGVVLDVGFEDLELALFGGKGAGDSGGAGFCGGELGGSCGGGGFDDFCFWEAGLNPVAALSEGLGMGVKFFDSGAADAGDEAVADGHDNLGDDFEVAVHEHVQRVGDDAFGGIFDGNDAVVGAAFAHFGEDVGDGFLGEVLEAVSESADGGLVGKGGFWSEEGDGHRFFKREGAGHNFAVDGSQGLAGYGALVEAVEFLKDGSFAVRRVDAAAAGQFDFSDSKNVFGPLVEEADDLRVDGVNGLAVFLQFGFVGWSVGFRGHGKMDCLLAERRSHRRPFLDLVDCRLCRRRFLFLRLLGFPNLRLRRARGPALWLGRVRRFVGIPAVELRFGAVRGRRAGRPVIGGRSIRESIRWFRRSWVAR